MADHLDKKDLNLSEGADGRGTRAECCLLRADVGLWTFCPAVRFCFVPPLGTTAKADLQDSFAVYWRCCDGLDDKTMPRNVSISNR